MCSLCVAAGKPSGTMECEALPGGTPAVASNESAGDESQTLSAPSTAYSYAQIADYLVNGFWQYAGASAHHFTTSTITYNISGLTAAGQSLAIAALATWQDVCNVNFVQTTGSAQLSFDDNYSGAYCGYSASGASTVSAYVNVSTAWLSSYGTTVGSYSFQTYIHEIGHALGLGHGGPYNGSASYSTNAIYLNDTWQYSVMSYFSQSNYGGSYRFIETPQIADIVAVQSMYGAASTRTGDTVYGFNSTAGSLYDFAGYSTAPALTVYDSGGSDTLDCSGYSAAQTINLNAGTYSSIGGLVNNLGIAVTTVIERAIGGSGGDLIYGNASGNFIDGSGGANTLWGGGGNDYVTANGNLNQAFGDDGSDQLYFTGNQNQLFGSEGHDWLGVNGTNNALVGGNGNEVWMGASGNSNTLNGEGGNDSLFANGAGNTMFGAADTDWLGCSGTSNALYGGAGNEWMGATGNGNYLIGGDDGDTLFSVGGNLLFGEGGNDWLGCSGNGNFLNGAQGNDYLAATGNNNTLDGGAGNDMLVAGGTHGGDRFVFHAGYGMDTISNFSRHGAGGTDVIDLNGFGLDFTKLQQYLSFEAGGVAVITIDAATVLRIAGGIPANGFLASDFIF